MSGEMTRAGTRGPYFSKVKPFMLWLELRAVSPGATASGGIA